MLYNNDGNKRGPNGNGTESVPHSGLAQIYAGHEAADFFGVPYSDPRYPDVFGRVQVGVVYTGGTKIAEHGGDNPGDRDVPLVVYAPGAVRPGTSDRGSRRPRSPRRSCACWASIPTRCRRSGSRARRSFRASAAEAAAGSDRGVTHLTDERVETGHARPS